MLRLLTASAQAYAGPDAIAYASAVDTSSSVACHACNA